MINQQQQQQQQGSGSSPPFSSSSASASCSSSSSNSPTPAPSAAGSGNSVVAAASDNNSNNCCIVQQQAPLTVVVEEDPTAEYDHYHHHPIQPPPTIVEPPANVTGMTDEHATSNPAYFHHHHNQYDQALGHHASTSSAIGGGGDDDAITQVFIASPTTTTDHTTWLLQQQASGIAGGVGGDPSPLVDHHHKLIDDNSPPISNRFVVDQFDDHDDLIDLTPTRASCYHLQSLTLAPGREEVDEDEDEDCCTRMILGGAGAGAGGEAQSPAGGQDRLLINRLQLPTTRIDINSNTPIGAAAGCGLSLHHHQQQHHNQTIYPGTNTMTDGGVFSPLVFTPDSQMQHLQQAFVWPPNVVTGEVQFDPLLHSLLPFTPSSTPYDPGFPFAHPHHHSIVNSPTSVSSTANTLSHLQNSVGGQRLHQSPLIGYNSHHQHHQLQQQQSPLILQPPPIAATTAPRHQQQQDLQSSLTFFHPHRPASSLTRNGTSTFPAHVLPASTNTSNVMPHPNNNNSYSGFASNGQQQQQQQPKKRQGGRRPKEEQSHLPPEEEEKRKLRRDRNKQAAARCRKRRLDHMNTLAGQVAELQSMQNQLHRDIEQLSKEKEELEFILKSHEPVCPLRGQLPSFRDQLAAVKKATCLQQQQQKMTSGITVRAGGVGGSSKSFLPPLANVKLEEDDDDMDDDDDDEEDYTSDSMPADRSGGSKAGRRDFHDPPLSSAAGRGPKLMKLTSASSSINSPPANCWNSPNPTTTNNSMINRPDTLNFRMVDSPGIPIQTPSKIFQYDPLNMNTGLTPNTSIGLTPILSLANAAASLETPTTTTTIGSLETPVTGRPGQQHKSALQPL